MPVHCDNCKAELHGMCAVYDDTQDPPVLEGIIPATEAREEQLVLCNACYSARQP